MIALRELWGEVFAAMFYCTAWGELEQSGPLKASLRKREYTDLKPQIESQVHVLLEHAQRNRTEICIIISVYTYAENFCRSV